MNLFQDEDGTAYVTYTSENNKTLYISKLNEDYTYLSTDPEKAVYKEDLSAFFQEPCGRLRSYLKATMEDTILCPPAPPAGCPTRQSLVRR